MDVKENRKLISIDNSNTSNKEFAMSAPFSLQIIEGEQYAIVGDNAAGKTRLTNILRGRYSMPIPQPHYDFGNNAKPYIADNIRYIAFRDTYGSIDHQYFMDQRFNSQEIDPETPTVGNLLDQAFADSGPQTDSRNQFREKLYKLFGIEPLLDKYIVLLSSGELRKYSLIKNLFYQSKILIIDNPYIGLDMNTRQVLTKLLETLAYETNTTLILVVSKPSDIPSFITKVIPITHLSVEHTTLRLDFIEQADHVSTYHIPQNIKNEISRLAPSDIGYTLDEIVRMSNVSIRYGSRTILSNLSWSIKRGEHWALSGENGAGKSTLLSIICADNPQSYACDIALFGRQRGSGESIWDIKKHIGYVSPEMHRAYQRDIAAWRIVASGLKDSIGLFYKPSDAEQQLCLQWMKIFGVDHLAMRSFMSVSSGEQRLILLVRAFVKSPNLLILDEPLHGLDAKNGKRVQEIIDTYCQNKDKTLIMVTHYKEELPSCIDHSLFLMRHH